MKTWIAFSSTAAAFLILATSGWAELNPTRDIPGCILWLDADDLGGDGASISEWRDKSGQGHDTVQGDPKRQPKSVSSARRGGSVLRFDGDDCLIDPVTRDWSNEDWTLFAVASLDADASNNWRGLVGTRFGGGAANWWTLGTANSGNLYLEMGAGRGVSSSFAPQGRGTQIYSAVKRDTDLTLHRNGIRAGSAPVTNIGDRTNMLRIGRWFGEGQEWDGDVAEILLYARSLDNGERERVLSYLSAKWSVSIPPNLIVRRPGWAETMLASRGALMRHAEKSGQNLSTQGGSIEGPVKEWIAELWRQVEAEFPRQALWIGRDNSKDAMLAWFLNPGNVHIEKRIIGLAGEHVRTQLAALVRQDVSPGDPRWLRLAETAAETRERHRAGRARLDTVNLAALRLGVRDLTDTFGERYSAGEGYLRQLDAWEKRLPHLREALERCDETALQEVDNILAATREMLLANPLLDFDELLLVQRSVKSPRLGLVQNWQSNCALPRNGFDDEIAVLSSLQTGGALRTLYRPSDSVFVGDVDLNFDADRMIFSSIGTNNRWQIFEIGTDGQGLRQVTPGEHTDVDNYDACYLPDGRILFSSSAFMVGVPCVNGYDRTANLYRMNSDGTDIRQLCFDQEHNWCPTVLPNGRVLYLRWEYTDTPHSHDRVLFHMNPDGTEQMEFYGSNSYWPNSLFYARPIPGRPSQFAGIVGGHHGVPRMGELVLFDVAKGRREADGVLQRIPGHGQKVEAIIADNLVDASWPKFLHPYPLDENYFLVSCKPSPDSLWGIYLVDVFDNALLLREEPGYALFEPIPFRKTEKPPVIPDKVDLKRKDAVVYLTDVYAGDGLLDVPRGTIKKLRLFTYHYLYPGMGGPQGVVGIEGPWDIKRIIGTVPVEEDGSANFRIPANTPISVQPLDAEGKAVQLMRSWLTGMPGEVVSCVGCHDSQNTTPPSKPALAMGRPTSEIEPWYGPTRGFSFAREVQPVLDRHCVTCHDGQAQADGRILADLRGTEKIDDYTSVFHHGGVDAGHFSVSYVELQRYVRHPGMESDYHMLMPMEYHADTTQLVQMLENGHHGVRLDAEGWDRLITWIDLNVPYHGTWTEIAGEERVSGLAQRRRELLNLYAAMDEDPEFISDTPGYLGRDAAPIATSVSAREIERELTCQDWPFGSEEAKRRQSEAGVHESSLDIGDGLKLDLVRIPAGEFVAGDPNGYPSERPLSRVRIEKDFWMGRVEVTNALFALFDPTHDSRVESKHAMQFGVRGFYVNGAQQPVVRVSWDRAMAFCEWLSDKTGRTFTLPTEAQWEYACRAGTATPFSYGDLESDFSLFANLGDVMLREFVCHPYKKEREPYENPGKYDDWIPRDNRFNDGGFVSEDVGGYQPNAWGLHDMHGNVSEWTRSVFRPYPYRELKESDGAATDVTSKRVARGGSWRDRPKRARSAFRLAYKPHQGVYNVGFRVVCEGPESEGLVLAP